MNNPTLSPVPVEANHRELIERLSDEADLCRNDGANDSARMLDEAVAALKDAAAASQRHALESAPRWIAMSEQMPPQDVEVLVWVTASPWAKHPYAALDTWAEQHEDPLGLGGPTLCSGVDWSEHYADGVTHWQLIAPPADSEVQR